MLKYTWTASNNSCMLDCSTSRFAVRNISAVNDSCTCLPGFYWVPMVRDCRLNCITVQNTAGVLSKANECKCKPYSVWSFTQKKCILRCPAIPNSLGTPSADGTTCACQPGYSWTEWSTCAPCAA